MDSDEWFAAVLDILAGGRKPLSEIAKAVGVEVESRVRLYPNANNATLGRLVFTRRPLRAPKKGTTARFFSLEELYSLG